MPEVSFSPAITIMGTSDRRVEWTKGAERGSMLVPPDIDFDDLTSAQQIDFWSKATGLKITVVAPKPVSPAG